MTAQDKQRIRQAGFEAAIGDKPYLPPFGGDAAKAFYDSGWQQGIQVRTPKPQRKPVIRGKAARRMMFERTG